MGRELSRVVVTGIKNYPEIVNGRGHVGYVVIGTIIKLRCLSEEIYCELTH